MERTRRPQGDAQAHTLVEHVLARTHDPYVQWMDQGDGKRNQLTLVFETDQLCNQGYVNWQRNNHPEEVVKKHLENKSYLAMPWLTHPEGTPRWSDLVKSHAQEERSAGQTINVATVGDCRTSTLETDPDAEKEREPTAQMEPSQVEEWLHEIAVQGQDGVQAVLYACEGPSKNGETSNQMLSSLLSSATSMDWDYLVLYGGGCDRAASTVMYLDSMTRRQVQETNNTTCDSKCQVQVNFLEGLLIGILLLVILLSGLCCLNYLETPSKFWTDQS
mmetsp:Transcript_1665/g.10222  ORF Transcript_1665/g.10222 Transcript_1665/m.10222 type:complete len:275 (-) Transcript_1665:490-1314(-)